MLTTPHELKRVPISAVRRREPYLNRWREAVMSIRKKLRLLFEEPQVGGTITVERAEPGTRPGCQAQRSAPKQESLGERVPGVRGLRLEDCVVYQCRRCRVVLGDSLHLCAQEEKLRLFVCFSELIGCFATQNEHTKVELPGGANR